METYVVNIRDYGEVPKGAVYIGREGRGFDGYFGNPFRIGKDGTRKETIAKYTEYFIERMETDKTFHDKIMELKGKTLVCFCKPKACHGDIIAAYLNYNWE